MGAWCGLSASLRANGSRECAPDDRLREAIHRAPRRKNGLPRRFRLRSSSYGGQVAPRNDVDGSEHDFAFSRHDLPEVLHFVCSLEEKRAQGRPDARCTRGLMCNSCNKNARMSIQEQRRTSGLPCAMALRLIRDRPGDRLCLSPPKRHQQRGARPSRFRRTQRQRSSSPPPRPPLPDPTIRRS